MLKAPYFCALVFAPAQRFEQYRTCSQSRAHFLRHAKGRPQVAQTLVGKSLLRIALGIKGVLLSRLGNCGLPEFGVKRKPLLIGPRR